LSLAAGSHHHHIHNPTNEEKQKTTGWLRIALENGFVLQNSF
jgi:hypothetical protein